MLTKVLKLAKLFTNMDHDRDEAKVVHIYDDGTVFMTDSFTAIQFHNLLEDVTEAHTLTPAGTVSEVPVFSDRERLMNETNCGEGVEVDVNEMLRLMQTFIAISSLDTENRNVQIGNFVFTTVEGVLCANFKGYTVSNTYRITDFNESVEVALTSEYAANIFKAFKDLGYTNCTIQFSGGLRPVHFKSCDGKVHAVVCPCRLYK